jgi:hypothetical protein
MKINVNIYSGYLLACLLLAVACQSTANAQAGLVPEGYAEYPFGEPATLPGDGSITVSQYDPDIALSKTNQFGDVVDTVSTLIHAEVCAGSVELPYMASEVYFSLARVISVGRESIPGTSSKGIREPSLQIGYVPVTVQAGECVAGWVAFTQLGDKGDKVLEGAAGILFNPAVLGMVPDDQQVKIAWRLPAE